MLDRLSMTLNLASDRRAARWVAPRVHGRQRKENAATGRHEQASYSVNDAADRFTSTERRGGFVRVFPAQDGEDGAAVVGLC